MQIRFISKSMYFDRPWVAARMDRKTRQALMFAGGKTKKFMQFNMRYRDRPAPPGTFPSAHRGHPYLRKFIGFGYDNSTKSLVVGPEFLPGKDREVVAAGKTVPFIVNEGGTVRRTAVYKPVLDIIVGVTKSVVWKYAPRPFVALTMPFATAELGRQMEKVEL